MHANERRRQRGRVEAVPPHVGRAQLMLGNDQRRTAVEHGSHSGGSERAVRRALVQLLGRGRRGGGAHSEEYRAAVANDEASEAARPGQADDDSDALGARRAADQ